MFYIIIYSDSCVGRGKTHEIVDSWRMRKKVCSQTKRLCDGYSCKLC